jgi:hypothetical protein
MIGPTTYVYYLQLLKAGAMVILVLVLAQALFGGQPISPRILLNGPHDAY